MQSYSKGQFKEDADADPNFTANIATYSYFLVGNNGCVYPTNTLERFEGLSNIKDVVSYYSKKTTYTDKNDYLNEIYCYAFGDDGVYGIKRNERKEGKNASLVITYELTGKVSDVVITKNTASGKLYLSQDGKLYGAGKNTDTLYGTDLSGGTSTATRLPLTCISDIEGYELNGKTITNIGYAGPTILAETSDGTVYGWNWGSGLAQSTTPTVFNEYDVAINKLFGKTDFEAKLAFIKLATNKGVTVKMSTNTFGYDYTAVDGKAYELKFNNGTLEMTDATGKYASTYVGGKGLITEVVGEWQVKSENGTTYVVVPSGTSSFDLNETTTLTDISEGEAITVQVDGATIVKQTEHKALDSNGNLYVWTTKTGLPGNSDEVVNLTTKEYYTEPVYYRGNGWTVIRSSF